MTNSHSKIGYRSHVGLHFTDALGVKVCSMQLILAETGHAIACADFDDAKLKRFRFVDSHRVAAENWCNGLISAPVSEMLRFAS